MGLVAFLSDLDQRDRKTIDGEIEFLDYVKTLPEIAFLEVPKWIRIDPICVVFVDMVNSSQIDFKSHPKTSAKIYETFTGSLVRTMRAFDAKHIEIQGDGVFAVFDGDKSYARGFIAATTFRTYTRRNLSPRIFSKTGQRVKIETRSGLSYGNIIVKRIGTRDFNNKVWAYNRVNQAVKLASVAQPECLVVSERAYDKLSKIDKVLNSCGCPQGERVQLWDEVDSERLEKKPVWGVEKAYELASIWCEKHGEEYMQSIIDECELNLPKLKSLEWADE